MPPDIVLNEDEGYRLEVKQGSTFTKSFQWQDSTGQGVKLPGASARLQIKDKKGGTVLADFSTDDGSLVITEDTGTTDLTIHSAVSADWEFVRGVWDLLITQASGEDKRLVEGEVDVDQSVTTHS